MDAVGIGVMVAQVAVLSRKGQKQHRSKPDFFQASRWLCHLMKSP